jgi:hypothetical protein
MQAVTNQRFDDLSASNIKKQLKKGTYDYVIVLTESEDYASNSSFFDGLDKIYANDAGFIAKIN